MRSFFQVNIGTRLAASFALTLLLTVAIAAAGISRLNDVASQTRVDVVEPMDKERLIADWYRQIFAAVRRTAAIVKSNDPSLTDYFKDDAATTARDSAKLVEQITPLIVEPREKELFEVIKQHRSAYTKARDAAIQAKAEGNTELAEQILNQQFTPTAKTYQAKLDELLQMQKAKVDGGAAHINAVVDNATILISVLAVVVVAFGALSAWLITRSITRPLHQAVECAEKIAQGDLTLQIDSDARDEAGSLLRALGRMNASLASIVGSVRHGTHAIGAASGEVANGSLELSARTEQQASALEETAASMEELTSTVRHNADNAQQANELAANAARLAGGAGKQVEQVVSTMGAIDTSSHKIVDIISVIDGIAFQTNILALNAAVEAARAGEQGRGFAVVASEVRNLAQRSSAAAKEIKALIDNSVSQVETGAAQVNRTGETMREVVAAIGRVASLMQEISTASREQIHGIDQVNAAVQQMDQTTQQNAALVEESSAAAATLQQQAAQLSTSVAVFRIENQQRHLQLA